MITTQRILSFFRKHWKELILVLSFLLVGFLLWRVHTLEGEIEQKKQTITVMSQEYAENLNALQNELKVNKQNAEVLQKEIINAQHGLRQPTAVVKVPVVAGDTPIRVVQEKLDTGDSTLPPEALEKTDKTVVVEQKDNPEVPVGIYKINIYRNWEAGIGFGYHDRDKYIPFSLQRNYDKQHSVMIEGHFDIDRKEVNGGEVQWKVHF